MHLKLEGLPAGCPLLFIDDGHAVRSENRSGLGEDGFRRPSGLGSDKQDVAAVGLS